VGMTDPGRHSHAGDWYEHRQEYSTVGLERGSKDGENQ
jgi:hypothetical protein